MPTITTVQKDGSAAIAADPMTKMGSCKCPARHKSHPTEIVGLGDSLIGVVGSTAHIRVVPSLARNHADRMNLCSVDAIFEIFRSLHFKGYDLIGTGMSALTNCGGYPLAFRNEELCASGLLGSLVRARDVQMLLLKHYPDGDHPDCEIWALWKMGAERKE